MNREQLRKWAGELQDDLQHNYTWEWMMHCVLNLIAESLAEPDYYDDGPPGEYDGIRTTNPDGTRTPPGYITLDELDAELEDDSPPVYPMDQTRTTNPDGTKTPHSSPLCTSEEAETAIRTNFRKRVEKARAQGRLPPLPPTLPTPDEVVKAMRNPHWVGQGRALAATVRELSWWITENRRTPANGERLDAAFATARKIQEMTRE